MTRMRVVFETMVRLDGRLVLGFARPEVVGKVRGWSGAVGNARVRVQRCLSKRAFDKALKTCVLNWRNS